MDRPPSARSNPKMQFVAPLHRMNVMKRESEISLTPSQISRLEKSNAIKKNPLDAITRPPKINEYLEKRSGLQNIKEDTYNQYAASQFAQKNTGVAQSQVPQMQQQQPYQQQHQQQQLQQQQQQQQQLQQQQQGYVNPAAQYNQQMNNNVPAAGARPQTELENKAPPSEPKPEDNLNAGNVPPNQPSDGFCTTCPNCAARILLVPENTENRAADDGVSAQRRQ